MLFAQEVAAVPILKADYTLWIAILVPAAFCALFVLFIVMLIRHLQFTREKLHTERL